MAAKRFKDANWVFATADGQHLTNYSDVQLALLMDIRDELKQLNALLHCKNFTGIPATLRGLRRDVKAKK